MAPGEHAGSGGRLEEGRRRLLRVLGKDTIRLNAALRAAKGRAILQLPEAASKKLPWRVQVVVQGTINGHTFRTVLEPDGNRGHWMNADKSLQRGTGVQNRRGGIAALLGG